MMILTQEPAAACAVGRRLAVAKESRDEMLKQPCPRTGSPVGASARQTSLWREMAATITIR
jgi:hypothetical protein